MIGLQGLQPIRNNSSMAMTAKGFSVPPSVGGLNARDELANMDERDALTMDNLFPEPSYVTIRKGYTSHATGMMGYIKTLMEWSGPSSRKLKAAVGSEIYDVTASGAVGAAELTGLSSAQWQYINFATAGGNFILAVNGSDAPINYDGAVWDTAPAITGVTGADLINIAIHKQRVWLVEKNTLSAWYLPVNSIGGAATEFPIGSLVKLGGKLIAIGTLSSDAGAGPDDYIAFITSRGEVVVYQGTNPNSANTWALTGVYRVGYPIGNRPVIDVSGDLAVITSDGIVSVQKMTQLDRASSNQAAITDKIQNLFNRAVSLYGSNQGWQGQVYPRGNWALFNIPISGTEYNQYVMNTTTGAWCRFTNMNAFCWGLMGDDLYFGGNGVVYMADTGYYDNSGPITANLKTAWNYFKSRGANKLFTLARPVIQTTGSPSILFTMNVDFDDVAPTGDISVVVPSDSAWGVAQWGVGVWGGDGAVINQWVTPGSIGYCGSMRMMITVQGNSFILNSFDVQAQVGGPL